MRPVRLQRLLPPALVYAVLPGACAPIRSIASSHVSHIAICWGNKQQKTTTTNNNNNNKQQSELNEQTVEKLCYKWRRGRYTDERIKVVEMKKTTTTTTTTATRGGDEKRGENYSSSTYIPDELFWCSKATT